MALRISRVFYLYQLFSSISFDFAAFFIIFSILTSGKVSFSIFYFHSSYTYFPQSTYASSAEFLCIFETGIFATFLLFS